jgi:hypothetical protein
LLYTLQQGHWLVVTPVVVFLTDTSVHGRPTSPIHYIINLQHKFPNFSRGRGVFCKTS